MFRLALPMLPCALAGYVLIIPVYGPVGAAAVSACIAGMTALAMVIVVLRVWDIHFVRLPHAGSSPTSDYWGGVAEKTRSGPPLECWREHMKVIYCGLVDRWISKNGAGPILKTDLFEEAVSNQGLLSYLGSKSVGLDQSLSVARAAQNSLNGDGSCSVVVCDLRALSFRTDSIGRILSGSSLDHFASEAELDRAIGELARILAPGGILVLTLDNPSNPIVWLRNRLTFAMDFYMGYTCSAHVAGKKLKAAGLKVTDCCAILHVPRAPAIWLIRLLERSGMKPEWLGKHMLKWEWLQQLPTKFRTGYYIALRAEKCPN
jgi:SAM-dependent methyltransferase